MTTAAHAHASDRQLSREEIQELRERVIAAVFEGPNAVKAVRPTVGKTNPVDAAPGTIRGDLGIVTGRNLVHASDEEPGSAERDVALWFKPEKPVPWTRELNRWYFED